MVRRKALTSDGSYKLLRKLPIFDALNDEERYFLSNLEWCFHVYDEGDLLTIEETTDERIFILLTGTASVIKGNQEKTISMLKPGDLFGEITFLTGTPRTASIIANNRCSVLAIDKRLMNEITIEIREKIKDQIIIKLSGIVKHMNNRFALGQL